MTMISLYWCGAGYMEVIAAEATPTAPTIEDAHVFFAGIVDNNELAALYTASQNGEILGYIRYPINRYEGDACNSAIALTNEITIKFDWTAVNKTEGSNGQISMWHNSNTTYEFFHMITLEGGVVALPSDNIPKLILTITDDISRNRLLKAMKLLSSSCRLKSKFD